MKKDTMIIMFGVLVALLPFLGLPRSWKTVLSVVLGSAIVLLAFAWRREMLKTSSSQHNTERKNDVYVENGHSVPMKTEYHADTSHNT